MAICRRSTLFSKVFRWAASTRLARSDCFSISSRFAARSLKAKSAWPAAGNLSRLRKSGWSTRKTRRPSASSGFMVASSNHAEAERRPPSGKATDCLPRKRSSVLRATESSGCSRPLRRQGSRPKAPALKDERSRGSLRAARTHRAASATRTAGRRRFMRVFRGRIRTDATGIALSIPGPPGHTRDKASPSRDYAPLAGC